MVSSCSVSDWKDQDGFSLEAWLLTEAVETLALIKIKWRGNGKVWILLSPFIYHSWEVIVEVTIIDLPVCILSGRPSSQPDNASPKSTHIVSEEIYECADRSNSSPVIIIPLKRSCLCRDTSLKIRSFCSCHCLLNFFLLSLTFLLFIVNVDCKSISQSLCCWSLLLLPAWSGPLSSPLRSSGPRAWSSLSVRKKEPHIIVKVVLY